MTNRSGKAISEGLSKAGDKIGDFIGCSLKFTDESKKECELKAKYKGLVCADQKTQAEKDECTKSQSRGDDDGKRLNIEVEMEERNSEQSIRARVKDATKVVTSSALTIASLAMLAM